MLGTYCSETDIESITAFAVDGTTTPNTTQVASWITKIEADADARGLASYTLTDQYVDVPREIGYPSKETVAWLQSIASDVYETVEATNIIILPFLPIVSITSLYRRTSSLGSTDAWEELTEGRESTDSFIILKKRTKTNQYLGFALYFHNNTPYSGVERIKATYVYGWNLNTEIIGEWCALKVALKVLDAVMHDSTPIGAGQYGVLDVSVSVDPERRRKDIINRIKEIEERYFPKDKLGLALI